MRRHMHHHHHGHGHGCRCHKCVRQPIVCPPTYRFHDTFTECEVPFVHPIVNVNRQNVVNVPRHYFTESETTVPGRNIYANGPGFGGPGFGGPGFGGPGSFRGRRY
ncbi:MULTISPECIES: hypothetical protein [Bhargavaea]|uniref:Spore coat protein D n=1 Tax=Bhargavaea changchunensis TaxID=2134037 RepID=A0ABW2NKC6_9BACL|nr:hypothetical protein [Bhargavaea sp. CC-171006]